MQVANPKELADRAYKLLSAGLDIEERNGNIDQAIEYYKQGIAELKRILNMRSSSDTLNAKIERNLHQFEKRLNELIAKKPVVVKSPVQIRAKQRPRDPASVALAHHILDEILVSKPNVKWDDIVGLEQAKASLHEIVVLPYLRPELFTGLREPARGVLLFGPPGTGKTMLAKAVATESKARFFAISASSLTSKNYGDGEKLVKALFEMARELQPSIIFIDEIDSILTERSEGEHEASRRLKTEFLLQFDGIGSGSNERILLLAASNRPQELDQAALRRMVKRIYIPLPELSTRKALITHLLKDSNHSLGSSDINYLAKALDGYSASDIAALAKEAALGPIRGLGRRLLTVDSDEIRPINYSDFQSAMKIIRPSVSPSYLREIEQWNKEKGVVGV
ncbi:hypothetical protein HDV04_000943 [Boothiomyces sp. JEL0838]|nr:hypothetical protein HDV04_000894 [Boothiomyces sp. JEL0838]KAJ3314220.1 hypothetical protein HDV04_000943 [Boothiomyces sp. JEL0838]